VWYRDTFDRETRPSVDVRGQGLVEGLTELWARHLFETVRHGGGEGQTAIARTRALNEQVAELLEGYSDAVLSEVVVAGRVTRWQVAQSLIAHNAYHTCSIICVRRMLGLWQPGRG
jgi:hypothetical protein